MTPDRPIQEGDLVMVVRPAPCCGTADRIGLVFTVDAVRSMMVVCKVANVLLSRRPLVFSGPYGTFHLEQLQRIDPPAPAATTRVADEVAA